MREPELTFLTVTFGWCLACSSLFNLVIELNFIVKLTQTYEEVTKAKENGIKSYQNTFRMKKLFYFF